MTRPLVVLLRMRQPADPYESVLERAGLEVAFQPVLDFEFVNTDALRRRFNSPEAYGGMVITSAKAVEAVDRVGDLAGWSDRPVFAVGPSTSAELRRRGFEVLGEGATRATELADFIVDNAPDGRLLFLCGNYRREVLPARLRAAGIRLDELIVYRTDRVPPDSIPDAADYVVFFSPSGVEAAARAKDFPWNRVRLAAIGPTTQQALEERSYHPAVIAAEPSPEGLVEALLRDRGITQPHV